MHLQLQFQWLSYYSQLGGVEAPRLPDITRSLRCISIEGHLAQSILDYHASSLLYWFLFDYVYHVFAHLME